MMVMTLIMMIMMVMAMVMAIGDDDDAVVGVSAGAEECVFDAVSRTGQGCDRAVAFVPIYVFAVYSLIS